MARQIAIPDPREVLITPQPVRVVKALRHLDDEADTGRYFAPNDVIEGWSDEKIARFVAANLAAVEVIV